MRSSWDLTLCQSHKQWESFLTWWPIKGSTVNLCEFPGFQRSPWKGHHQFFFWPRSVSRTWEPSSPKPPPSQVTGPKPQRAKPREQSWKINSVWIDKTGMSMAWSNFSWQLPTKSKQPSVKLPEKVPLIFHGISLKGRNRFKTNFHLNIQ